MKKNLCIFSILLVSLISLSSVHSSPVEEHEAAPAAESEPEPAKEEESEVKDYVVDCFAQINSYRGRHSAASLRQDGGLSGACLSCARRYVAGAPVHSCPEARGMGETVASSSGGGITVQQLCTIGVSLWYAECRLYNYNNPNIWDWERTGHFTYMVWRNSTLAGLACAAGPTVRCVALFKPQGNYPTVTAYKANVWPPRKELGEVQEDYEFLQSQVKKYNITIS